MLLRALILGICFSFFGGMICDFSTVYASNTGTENVEQNRKKKKKSTKKKTYKKKSNSNVSSFGQAYRDARKKGLKTFKHNGKTYTTVKDTDNKKNVTNNNKNVTSTNKKTNRESASYKNVSFGSAYKDAKKKGISTFTWNGKKYTTEKTVKKNTKNTKSNNKKYTKSKKKSNKKYSKKKTSNKKRYTTTKKKSSNTYKSSNNSYTPPPTYNNDNSGREYKRESSNDNTPVKKEPKKE